MNHSPRNVSLLENETARFSCAFTGLPKPVIIWQRETYGLPQLARTNKLVLELRNNTTGEYTVIINITSQLLSQPSFTH